jgi:hypothetical protein
VNIKEIYLCREHTAVGDEFIRTATTNAEWATNWARENCRRTGTQNYDVVVVKPGQERQ